MPEHEQPPEDIVRKLSRVALRAAEKGKKSLFDRLTKDNAEKVERLSKERSVFFENDETAETKIELDSEIEEMLPPEFFENPTEWIEAQGNIKREHREGALPKGKEIEELWGMPYDVSKVKSFDLTKDKKKVPIVSKRITPEQLEEITLARRAYEAGIPTPRVLGEIRHHGNVYALFERIPAINLTAFIDEKIGSEKRERAYTLATHISIASTEKEFNRIIQELSTIGVQQETQDRLRKLWKEKREHIVIWNITNFLQSTFLNPHNSATLEAARDHVVEEWNGISRSESDEDLNHTLHFHGYQDLDDFLRSLPYFSRLDTLNLWNRAHKKREAFTDELIARASLQLNDKEFTSECVEEIERDVLGIALMDAEHQLEELCKERGIEHKDFNLRNILIEWDFERDVLLRREGQDPRLFIVDWEPKPKSAKEKSKG